MRFLSSVGFFLSCAACILLTQSPVDAAVKSGNPTLSNLLGAQQRFSRPAASSPTPQRPVASRPNAAPAEDFNLLENGRQATLHHPRLRRIIRAIVIINLVDNGYYLYARWLRNHPPGTF